MQRSGMGVSGFRVQDLLGSLESILDSNDQDKGPQTTIQNYRAQGLRAQRFGLCFVFEV